MYEGISCFGAPQRKHVYSPLSMFFGLLSCSLIIVGDCETCFEFGLTVLYVWHGMVCACVLHRNWLYPDDHVLNLRSSLSRA